MTPEPVATPDQLFERFRKSGDVDALAAVFDRCAGKLLRLAMNLATDAAAAEDLVQHTFLTAIERAQSFDGTRELMPWLGGILTNHARNSRRAAERATASGDLPDALVPERSRLARVEDPFRTAADHELASAVTAALAQLGEPYREVLVLNLRHGLLPSEIADALDRAPGTVRSQLHRGLELLRALLPAGFAASAVLALSGTRGLAAVKQVVVAHAALPVGVAAAAPLGIGGLLVMKKLGVVLVVGVLGLAAFGVLPTLLSTKESPSPATVVASPRQEPLAEAAPESAASRVAPLRAPAEPPATVPAASGAALLVRVVSGNPPQPVPQVGVHVAHGGGNRLSTDLDLREGVSAADGTVRFLGLLPGRVSVHPDRGASQFPVLVAGAAAEVVVDLGGGHDLEGSVVSEHGSAVPGATLWVFADPNDWRDAFCVGKAGPDGRFALRCLKPTNYLAARAEGLQPSRLVRVAAALKQPGAVRLELGSTAGSLTGRVQDARGQGIDGALVLVGDTETNRVGTPDEGARLQFPALRLRTEPGGTFTADGMAPGPVLVWAKAHGFGSHRKRVTCSVGSAVPVEVTLPLAATVSGVVKSPGGTPLANVNVSVLQRHEISSARSATAATGADGQFRIEGITPGQADVRVLGSGSGSAERRLDLQPGELAVCELVLDPGARITGRVVDERGQPLSGWTVTPRAPDGSNAGLRTDKEGRFALNGLPMKPHRLEVHEARGEAGPPRVVGEGILPGGSEVTLTVPESTRRSAFVLGTVLGADGRPAGAVVVRAEFRAEYGHRVVSTVQSDPVHGRFELGPLSPGAYRICLAPVGLPERNLGEHLLATQQRLDLGEIQLQRGGIVEVSLAREDGQPVTNGSATLVREGTRHGTVKIGDARFRSAPLPPGAYRLECSAFSAAGTRRQVEVRAGEETKLDLVLAPGALRFLIFSKPAGHPRIQQFRLRVFDAEGSELVDFTSPESTRPDSALGLARGFGLGTYRFEASTETGLKAEGTFAVTDLASHDVQLRFELR